MKIVADENILLVEHYFAEAGECILKPGREITRSDLIDADILLVRSVTEVNERLLRNTAVKFVGSTTTGSDHLDIDYLNSQGISWSIAKGCNAIAVVEYVLSVLASLYKQSFLSKKTQRAAVIGVGQIGSLVSAKLKLLGFEVLECDPFRSQVYKQFSSVTLDDISEVDFVTLHTPLTKTGLYPTFHMIDKQFLQRQKKGCILLNSGRGSVINFEDLKKYGTNLHWCLDVWENEPHIDLAVLEKSCLATPHIAGYSLQSKFRGIEMIYEVAIQQNIIPDRSIQSLYPKKLLTLNENVHNWKDLFLLIYDPYATTQLMKETLHANKDSFDVLRKNFLERYESHYIEFENLHLAEEELKLFKQLRDYTN